MHLKIKRNRINLMKNFFSKKYGRKYDIEGEAGR